MFSSSKMIVDHDVSYSLHLFLLLLPLPLKLCLLCLMVIGLWRPIHVFFILDSGVSQTCLVYVLAVAATAPHALPALPYDDWSVVTNPCSLHLR